MLRWIQAQSANETAALAGRLTSGMAGCVIPSASLTGYHTTARGQRLYHGGRRLRRGLPPGRRAVGLHQADGMTHKPRRGERRSKPGANGLGAPVTFRDAPAQTPATMALRG